MPLAACYLRVSTDAQTVESQRADVERLCAARGLTPVWHEETGSALAAKRPAWAAVLDAARRGDVTHVVVWALDRAHRSLGLMVRDVLELDRVGVALISVREPWIDTSGPVRGLLVAVFGWVAEQERVRLRERTRAGLDRARREGKQLGRPRASPTALGLGVQRVRDGWTVGRAARVVGVSDRTLRRELRRVGVATPRAGWRPG